MDINELEVDFIGNRTDEFMQTARELSDYLDRLNMHQPINDKLVGLMSKHSNAAELSGFKFGVTLTAELLKSSNG